MVQPRPGAALPRAMAQSSRPKRHPSAWTTWPSATGTTALGTMARRHRWKAVTRPRFATNQFWRTTSTLR